jgi:hypothetical protein
MDCSSLAEKSHYHRCGQAEICSERKRIRIDWLQFFKSHFNSFTFQSFDKFPEQQSGLLGEGIKDNENPFPLQMKSPEST